MITGRYGIDTGGAAQPASSSSGSGAQAGGTRDSHIYCDLLVSDTDRAVELLGLRNQRMPRYAAGAVRIGRMLAAMVKQLLKAGFC